MSKIQHPRRLAAAMLTCALAALSACTADPEANRETRSAASPDAATPSRAVTLTGQLLLPGEGGRRGVEVHVWTRSLEGDTRQHWILPKDDGSFVRDVTGPITRMCVFAGRETHPMDPADLPPADAHGRIDLGAIDLREALVGYRVRIRAADGAPDGQIRASLSIGPSHTGPRGELPSLGSGQFPELELGRVTEWLLPPGTDDVHFLVERPDGPDRGVSWRSGVQQVYGPYAASAFPIELLVD